MKIDFESPHLELCIEHYYGEMEDGRQFTIIFHKNYGSDWVDTIEHDEEFTTEELDLIEEEFLSQIR